MRVAVHPCDENACGHYRLRWPAEVLAADGHDVTVETEMNRLISEELGLVDIIAEADVVVFQRPLDRHYCDFIPLLQRRGVAVVVEIDDDFHALPKGHGAKRATSVGASPGYNRRWLRKACEMADLVTVTTPALAARYGAHGRVVVLPNLVPESYLSIDARKRSRPRVGWTGSVVTHVGDLDVMGGVLPDVLTETGARFVGLPSAVEALGLSGADAETMEWKELTTAYPHFVAGFDVGIVPLADNPFNAAKSWLKGLEFAALGVPFVASPREDYLRLGDELGDMPVAFSAPAWRTWLTLLLSDPDQRAEQGARNRAAASSMTYEQHADRWMDAWTAAADNRVGAAA